MTDSIDKVVAEMRATGKAIGPERLAQVMFDWANRLDALRREVPDGFTEKWWMCGHPAWPAPLDIWPPGRESAIDTIKRNPHPNARLMREWVGGRVEYIGDDLANLIGAKE